MSVSMILLSILAATVVLLFINFLRKLGRRNEINPFKKVGKKRLPRFVSVIVLIVNNDSFEFPLLVNQLDKNKNFVDNAELALEIVSSWKPIIDLDRVAYNAQELYSKLKAECYDKNHQFIGDERSRLRLTICDSFVYVLRKEGRM